ncbi:hypothetical protein LO762_09150 [Actinocorallia sp. API 0066]|uniref:hypothetical protein n=1 Tax=Actinocorallia sp. API 0066 TaxID=2896846 RepID=UPI001E4BC12A|nr:hypothetical protein [Actinocorallia sp. API 0066]MCD0449354.1 hypothetical protein [Actinocorallia sp. API 0066]
MTENIPELVRGLNRLAQPTDSPNFGLDFVTDPATALAAKGLVLSADEQARINAEVADIVENQSGVSEEAVEVEVSVKVKF